ncbi:MAG: acyl carrier protein, partial [Phenylobacterium sp.]
GRNDNQVKLRGFRIELGEIETQLLACEEIKAAVVQVTSDNSQIQQLVAYVIVEDQFSGQGVQLQSHFKAALAQMLPEYMIPGIFMFLDLFPQTPNGKLDVQALPQPQSSVDISDYSEPETDTEQQLAQIWSTLLKVDVGMIGQRANFFDMGGHSLLLMRLVGEIKTRFAVELQIRDIFELSTLSAIAGAVDEALIKLGFEPLLGDDDGKEEILI